METPPVRIHMILPCYPIAGIVLGTWYWLADSAGPAEY
jgi:hypothetical protein